MAQKFTGGTSSYCINGEYMRKSVTAAVLGILLLAASSWAEETPAGPDRLRLGITAGAEQSYWQINRENQCQGCPVGVVDYQTEGLGFYRVDATLFLGDQALLKVRREAPLSPTERQKEILLV